MGAPGGSVVKNPPASAGDAGLISGSGRSPEGGNSNTFQYSYLGNPMDRGAWRPIVHGITKSQTRLSDFTFFLSTFLGRKAMTNLDSILKSRDIALPTKGPSSQGYDFSSSHVWM